MNNLTKTALAMLISATTSGAFASAFQLSEVSTSGLGMAYAGDAAVADNASVIATNPALMTQFKQMEISLGGIYVDAKVDLEGTATYQSPFNRLPSRNANQKNVVPSSFVPNFYVLTPINDKFSVGGGVNVNFGMKSQFDSNYSAGVYGGTTKLAVINFNVSGGYRLSDHFSLGGGLNLAHADATLERNAGMNARLINMQHIGSPVNESTVVSKLRDKAWGYGWNVGLVYEFNADHRIGISYHSAIDFKLKDGEAFRFDYTGNANLTLNLPAYWEISGYHKLTDKLAAQYSYKRTEWSRFKQLHAVYDNGQTALYKPEYFNSSQRVAFGLSYDALKDLTLRTGIAYDETPIASPNFSASIPDSDRTWYTLGATYRFTPNLSVDFAYAKLKAKDNHFTESESDKLISVSYKSKSKADLYGINVNFRF